MREKNLKLCLKCQKTKVDRSRGAYICGGCNSVNANIRFVGIQPQSSHKEKPRKDT